MRSSEGKPYAPIFQGRWICGIRLIDRKIKAMDLPTRILKD